MAKQDELDLPTLEDFTESSLLDIVEEQEQEEEEVKEKEEEEKQEKSKETAEVLENPLETKIPEAKEKKEEKEEEEKEEEEEDTEEETNEQENFWSDVEKITGVTVDVDYKDTDPESPEGAALREAALVQNVENSIWKYIETNFPKSYKALTLEANGGDLSQLITPDYVDYAKIELQEDNAVQHKKILMDYYTEVKQLSEKKALRMVEADEDSEDENGLFIAAKEALEERKEIQQKREDAIVAEQQAKAEAQAQQDQQMLQYIKAITDTGTIGNFELARAEKDQFFQFFASQVNRNPGGGYLFSVPLTNENFNHMMEQAYFSFKGADVSKLVQRRAKTENTRRLKRQIQQEKLKQPSQAADRPATKKLPTMGDFMEN